MIWYPWDPITNVACCDFCHPNQFCQAGIQLKLSAKSFTATYHPEKNDMGKNFTLK
jgi:hypothetical protein